MQAIRVPLITVPLLLFKLKLDIITFLILILLSAFFSSSETAFLSLDKIKVKQIESAKRSGAKRMSALLSSPNKLLVTILIGNTFVNIAASAVFADLSYDYFGEKGIFVSIAAMTILLLIFGEVTPKMFALFNGEAVAYFASRFLHIFQWLFTPVRVILSNISYSIVRGLGLKIYPESFKITEQEIKSLFSIGKKSGVVKKKEKDMIDNILEFKELNAADIMSPRINIAAVDLNLEIAETIEKIKKNQYSRFPVYAHTLDNIVGVVHSKDILLNPNTPIKEIIIKPIFVPESMKIDDLLQEMQNKHTHLAIVTDEYGVTSGVVTIEDVIEQIVGEIRDELDYELPNITKSGIEKYHVNGQTHIDEVNDTIGTKIETLEVDTIGGFVVLKIGRIPQNGDSIEIDGYRYFVNDVSKNRITSLTIEKIL